jgi:hypothetical protein
MALMQDEQLMYTKWAHVENGQVMVRRIHRIEVQTHTGRLYVLTGNLLPDFIQTCAGVGYKGAHLAQILLNPKSISTRPFAAPETRTWPSARDIAHVAIGIMSVLSLRFIFSAWTGTM